MNDATARPAIPDLISRIPVGRAVDADEALEIFLDWTIDLDFELYPHQEEALLEILAGRHVVLSTPTGSGKSLVAVAVLFHALLHNDHAVYTAPIKALVSEKFFELCRVFGADNVGMLTGDAAINRDAPIICCTAEVLANMALREGPAVPFRHAVLDEFHFFADPDRGMAWQIPLLVLHRARFLLMSATLGDTSAIADGLEQRTGREVATVTSVDRPVPLAFDYSSKPLHEAIPDLIHAGRAPVYLVNFSQREATEQAQNLMSVDLASKDQKKAIHKALKGFRFDTPFGPTVERFIRHGVGVHHAGLLPKYRLLVEKLAQQGLLHVVSGTDTLGVGVNVPIRTVLFTKLCKYDGEKTRLLKVREFQQIAGRAGRKGFDDQGWVVAQAPEHVIANQRLAAKVAAGAKKKKVVKQQPPQRGFVPWSRDTFEQLTARNPEPLTSVFRLDHGTLLNLLQRPEVEGAPGGYRAVGELIAASHVGAGRKRALLREAAALFRALRGAGIVRVVPRRERAGADVEVDPELQQDFSLFHALSLFLIDAIERLDRNADDYALDVLTLVESLQEHPRPILAAQVNVAKGELVAQLKAEGVDYEDRMAALEDVTYPKPRGEWIYDRFDEFADAHPWVGHAPIRPKSVARDLVERYLTFVDYVREYRVERMEGVLLRYLTQAYKGLEQIVPEPAKDQAVLDVEAYLRATLARVDDSLLVEWERMLEVPDDLADAIKLEPVVERDLAGDARALLARVRAELHRLVKALAERDYDEAAACVATDDDDPWTAERFEAALADFLERHGRIVFDHRARLADKMSMRKIDDRVWEVSQILCDPDDDNDTTVDAVVDLRAVRDPGDAPILTLQRIG